MNDYQVKLRKIPKWFSSSLLLFFFFAQIVLILIFINNGLIPIIILFLIFFLFVYTAFSVERMYYLFTFYVAIAPASLYISYFPGFPISFSGKIAIPLFALVLFYWLIYLLRNSEVLDFKSLDWAVLIYFIFVILSAVRGFLYGFKLSYFMWDLITHMWYLCYFIFHYSPLRLDIKKFFDMILFFTIIVSLEFIYGFSQTSGFIFLKRIVARNIHLALFAIPYISATLIYGANRSRKVFFASILPIILLAVLFSQQRSLWLSVILTILILSIIFIYSRRNWIRNHLKTFFKFFIIGVLVIFIIFFIIQTQTKNKLLLTIIIRLFVFLNPSLLKIDISWLVREHEIAMALKDLGNQFLFGSGFGASIVSADRHFVLTAPDNAYIYLLWKMGIVGLLSFIVIQFLFIKRCFLILRKTLNPDEKIFALTGLLNTFGLIIVGFANSCITQYEYLVIWMAIIAAIEVVSRQYG